jgi:hypothetical protein
MPDVRELRSEQIRQIIDTEQTFAAWNDARREHDARFSGSMSWKRVGKYEYLYRKTRRKWSSLGPRDAETEALYLHFLKGRVEAKKRVSALAQRLNELAPVNRAMRIGRMPSIAARILNALSDAGLFKSSIEVVGTNALFAYERLAGVQFNDGQLATGDIDLLFDARASLSLLSEDVATTGVLGLLHKVDRSFARSGKKHFWATNESGYMVDLITPMPKNRMTSGGATRIGRSEDDLTAVEIEGLVWLVNSPKVEAIVIDERGFPVTVVCPDPRAFAAHKLWLSERSDRDALRRRRDKSQAELLIRVITARLPNLSFEDSALNAIPRSVRQSAITLAAAVKADKSSSLPDW